MLEERYLDKKSLNFLSFYFELPKTNFRCYILQQSTPQHWNYNAKYSDGSEFLVRKSLVYFEDAEEDDIPSVFDKSVTWPIVKRTIELEAKKL